MNTRKFDPAYKQFLFEEIAKEMSKEAKTTVTADDIHEIFGSPTRVYAAQINNLTILCQVGSSIKEMSVKTVEW